MTPHLTAASKGEETAFPALSKSALQHLSKGKAEMLKRAGRLAQNEPTNYACPVLFWYSGLLMTNEMEGLMTEQGTT
jgi:hypothetical protein